MSITTTPPNPAAMRNELESKTILAVGWRHKSWVLLGIIGGIIGGVAVGRNLPNVYQSTAEISILRKRPDSVSGVDTRNMAADDYLAPPQELLRSSVIIDSAIRSKGFRSLTGFEDKGTGMTEQIRSGLTVTPSKGPPGQQVVFKLAYRSGNLEECQTVLTAVLDSFQEFIDKKHQSMSVDSIELILREKQALQKSIEEKEAAYLAFRERAPLPATGKDGLELRQERLNSIQAKRSALLLQRVEVERQLATLEAAVKEGCNQESLLALLIEFSRKSDSAEPERNRIASLQEQLLALVQEEQRLLQIHGAKHAEVLAVKSRIDMTRRLMVLPASSWKVVPGDDIKSPEDPVALHMQLLTQKLNHLKMSEDMLRKVFQEEQEDARRLATFEIQNDSFRTSLNLDQQMYETLAKRLNEATLIRNVGGYQIEMIEPPTIGKRVAPSMAVTLMVGAFLGAAVGLGLAFWASARRRTSAISAAT